MFPEGTRHSARESGMLPFKKGAFHLAVQAGVPIVPVVCQNYWHLYHKGVLEPGKLKIVGKYAFICAVCALNALCAGRHTAQRDA